MATVACNVFGGMSGYVPVYSNSKGGTLLGHVDNGKTVYKIVGAAEEFGFAQIDKRVVQDAAPDMRVTDTGQYWMEKSHMEEIVTPPSVEKTMVVTGLKWSSAGIELIYEEKS